MPRPGVTFQSIHPREGEHPPGARLCAGSRISALLERMLQRGKRHVRNMAGPALEDSDTGSDGNCFRAAELLSGGWSASCSQEATFKLRLHDPRSQRGGGRGCGELSGLECRWPEAWGSGEGSSETSL